ncbi:MAG TPA: LLM class F420-dependent oxidoreductase [Solirubrobacteraceae bacterium]|jgi:probable F420-dependent oxidoreductase
MTVDIGRFGIWVSSRSPSMTPELAQEIESLGFGTIWLGSSATNLDPPERFLDSTSRIAVATAIVNMWASPSAEVGASYHRVVAKHPGRFLLGVGIGHPEANAGYHSPYQTILNYLDDLDAAGVPKQGRLLAALGPRTIRLAGERTAGAHPFMTTPAHTRQARSILGAGPLLAPEQKVVLSTDADYAHSIGRQRFGPVLRMVNYRNSMARMGFAAEQVENASDEVLDAVIAYGTADDLVGRLNAHLDAGADHVSAYILTASGDVDDEYRQALRALADALPQAHP